MSIKKQNKHVLFVNVPDTVETLITLSDKTNTSKTMDSIIENL